MVRFLLGLFFTDLTKGRDIGRLSILVERPSELGKKIIYALDERMRLINGSMLNEDENCQDNRR